MALSKFSGRLSKLRAVWQLGLVLEALIRVGGLAAVVTLVYAAADFFLALGVRVREVAGVVLAGALLLLWATWIIRALVRTNREMADRADALLGSRRRTVLSAFELESWVSRLTDAGASLRRFLVQQSVARALSDLRRLRFKDYFPIPELRGRFKILSVQLLAVALAASISPDATQTILRRLVAPRRDIPPYSRYRFVVEPLNPRVIYGGDVDITARITGAPVRSQVWLVTRLQDQTHRTTCFQESEDCYAQKLEKVVGPIEFCFATGKARSRWHQLDVLLQPQIALASVTVKPPAYSDLPKRQFFLGNEDFAALADSEVELTLVSNRPLLDGSLAIRPVDEPEAVETITGARSDLRSVAFQWTLKRNADLEVVVRDIRGTRNKTPLKVRQQLVIDKPPEAAISEPAGFALATPSITIPLEGYAEDDLGLNRVDMVRTVVGYRDRMTTLGPAAPEIRLAFDQELDLKRLGVVPGQILEFYIEAMDSNPSLVGIAASEVVRVQIISDDDYAMLLRAQTTIDDLSRRYQAIRREMEDFIEALNELNKLARDRDAAPADTRKALDRAQGAASRAAELYEKVAADYPIYDFEKNLALVLRQTAAGMRSNADKLSQLAPDSPALAWTVGSMLSELEDPKRLADEEMAAAEELLRIAKVFEYAARYRRVVGMQQDLVRRLDRYEQEDVAAELRRLPGLGRRQEEIRVELVAIAEDLPGLAVALPPGYEKLRDTAIMFADYIYAWQIPDLMSQANTAAQNQDGRETHRLATLALEKLQQLMTEPPQDEGFGALAQGRMEFEIPEDVKSTLQQMLTALAQQLAGAGRGGGVPGPGIGNGGAGPMGGDVGDGYWMSGSSPLNLPMYGPSRMSFGGADTGARGIGDGTRGRGDARAGTQAGERMQIEPGSEIESQSMPAQNVPDKYRDAVKKYFSSQDNREGANQ